MKTRVMMVVGKGQVEMVEKELPELGPKDVLVKVLKSLVSPGTERAFILNLENTSTRYPFNSGYAAVSVVEAVGAEVTDFSPGDMVTSFGTGHMTYNIDSEINLVKIPANVPIEEAAFTVLGGIAIQGVRKTRLELGESCAVIGLGPIGQIALQLTKTAGACPVIALDKEENRLNTALECGADIAINTSADNWKDKLSEYGLNQGIAAVIDSTGFPAALQSALDIVGVLGRVALLGSTRGDCTLNVYRDIHKKGLTLIGAHAQTVPGTDSSPGFWTYRQELQTFLNLLSKGKLQISKLISIRVESRELVDLFYNKVLKWDLEPIGIIVNWQ